ncbi:polysaccharide pyruvyl transferase family protein [Bradyrhizobium sp. CCGUVB1N3]|uniref:polysaccharide pyruvyl transferase family protein n=1 Tax=Bradyrhizobium sp. CCGUVB1N3 TaxID=2949629 RepID=UPI0020B40D56|nr:polysaccharide pyruvyl transferase family protein [Bradyrhizobium sp. CCGUVB1N3]MCP3472141.1 polysaccharide pyruvyl transferase family protein [Bradyrhizobium sp. CCGUVB1N3]
MTVKARNKTLEIGLLWHTFSHGNLGVDALARGHANLLRRAAQKVGVDAHFTSLGAGQNHRAELPSDVTNGPEPQLKQLMKGNFGFLDAVRSCDVIFDIGEGDSFTDIYGVRRFARLAGTKLAALALAKPLILAPQTIGPFNNLVCRRTAIMVMRRATGVFTRDDLSSAFLSESGIANAAEFIDVAFAVPVVKQAKAADRLRVCLNVSGLLYNQGYTGKNELGMALDYASLTHSLIEGMSKRSGVEIHLLAHVSGSGGADDDAPVMHELKRRYPSAVTAPLFETAEQAKSYLSGMDFVVAGRMHACIGAFSAGVPVVPIAYSRKFNGLFNTLRYTHYIDGKVDNEDVALGKIMAAFDARDALALDVERGLTIADARLARYEDQLIQILTDASGTKSR